MWGSEMATNLTLSNANPRLKKERTTKITAAKIKTFEFFIKLFPPSFLNVFHPIT
jgi:hypothetical protein